MLVEPAQTTADTSRAHILMRLARNTAHNILDLISANVPAGKIGLHPLKAFPYTQKLSGYEYILSQSYTMLVLNKRRYVGLNIYGPLQLGGNLRIAQARIYLLVSSY